MKEDFTSNISFIELDREKYKQELLHARDERHFHQDPSFLSLQKKFHLICIFLKKQVLT